MVRNANANWGMSFLLPIYDGTSTFLGKLRLHICSMRYVVCDCELDIHFLLLPICIGTSKFLAVRFLYASIGTGINLFAAFAFVFASAYIYIWKCHSVFKCFSNVCHNCIRVYRIFDLVICEIKVTSN